jgi:hypothetical protein
LLEPFRVEIDAVAELPERAENDSHRSM